MKRNVIRNIVTAAVLLSSGVFSIDTFAQDNVYAYRNGSSSKYASYASLSAALSSSNLQNNDIIELRADISETGNATISKNNIVIRSTSGQNYTVSFTDYVITTAAPYTVTGTGLNVSNITFTGHHDKNYPIFDVSNNGTTTFGSQCIFKDNDGGAPNHQSPCVRVNNDNTKSSKVVVDGAQFINNKSRNGAGIYLSKNAELTVNGSTTLFSGNMAISYDAVSGGGSGGAISVNHGAKATINAGTFTLNSGQFGGVANVQGTLIVNGGTFYKNDLAIVTSTGFDRLEINGEPVFEANEGNYGPAIQLQSWGTIPGPAIINGGIFKDNIANADGGAVDIRCANQDINLVVNGGTFIGNKALSGGAIDCTSGGKLTVNGGIFKDNVSTAHKGNAINPMGVFCMSGSPVFEDDQDVHLGSNAITGIVTYNVITKIGELGSELTVPVTVDNAAVGRDILVSTSGASASSSGKVIPGDSKHFSMTGVKVKYDASGLSSAVSAYSPADVIEISAIPSVLSIKVTGLAKGESEVFGIYSIGDDDAEELVMNIAVTGKGSGTDTRSIRGLEAGNYKIDPTSWDWAYTNSEAQSVTVADATSSTATFTVTAKSDQPVHSEKARINEFK